MCNVRDIRGFNKIVIVTRIFSASNLYSLEINVLKEDPINGDWGGLCFFSVTTEDKKYYSLKCCDGCVS